MRLRIIEENLQELSDTVYYTDYAGDIANWLINKPKPYRLLYDRKRDLWLIADADKVIHMDMARIMYTSGLVQISDSEMNKMRDMMPDNIQRLDNGTVFANYGFNVDDAFYGLFFIPNGESYLDYEKAGFYKAEFKLKSGTLFVKRPHYLSSDGIFSSLYNKLNMMKAFVGGRKPLEDIDADVRRLSPHDFIYVFTDRAFDNGYSGTEINTYLRSLPEYSLENIYSDFVRFGYKAATMFEIRAKRLGYTQHEIDRFLAAQA